MYQVGTGSLDITECNDLGWAIGDEGVPNVVIFLAGTSTWLWRSCRSGQSTRCRKDTFQSFIWRYHCCHAAVVVCDWRRGSDTKIEVSRLCRIATIRID